MAEAFVSEVERGIGLICDHPRAWQAIEEDVRRYILHWFPLGIYYTLEDDGSVLVLAVMHLSRQPRYWRDRLV